ncbi:MAG: right-handed parallel beta-helix repeat-containing protein [Candidatus Stygibacter frigidus]|nr:right-handed parallel beta-helix repeat-containing protein [Candidatus Stygibacter frigidus]
MKKLIVLSFLLVAFIATLTAAKIVSPLTDDGSYDPTRTYTDFSNFPNTRDIVNVDDYATVQLAIDNANPNDIVHFGVDTYLTDALTINKPLTLEGSGSGTILQFTSYVTTTDSKRSVFYINSGPDAFVNIYNMSLIIDSDIGTQGSSGVGVYIYESSCLIDGLDIDFNEWSWLGIYAIDMNPEHNAEFTATNCSVTGILKNGITCNGPGLDVTFTGNTVYGPSLTNPAYTGNIAGNGLQIGKGAAGIISNNIIYDFYARDVTYGSCGILTWNTTDSSEREIELSDNSIYDCQAALSAVEDYGLTVTMNNNNIYWTSLRIDPITDDAYSPAGIDVFRYYNVNNSNMIANVTNNNIVRYPVCDSMKVTGYSLGSAEGIGWGSPWNGDAPLAFNFISTTFSGISNAFKVYGATKLIEINCDDVDLDLDSESEWGFYVKSNASTLVDDKINVSFNFTNSTISHDNSSVYFMMIFKEFVNPGLTIFENNDFSGVKGFYYYNSSGTPLNAEHNYWYYTDPTSALNGPIDVTPWYTDATMTELAHPAAKNVMVSKLVNDVTLDWEAWDSESVTETYKIFRTYGNPYVSTGWETLATDVALLTATYSQTEDYAFYRVCLTDEEDYVESDVVGYYTVNCDINDANTNLNFISIPLSTEYTNASDYVENVIELTNCNMISKWVVSAQAWQTATYVSELGIWFGDFAIEENGAYLMGCLTDDLSYVVTGYLPAMPEYTLVTGNNLIMVPMDVAAGTDSGTFYDNEFDLELGDTISNWDFSTQGYNTYSYNPGMGGWGSTFIVNPGNPVMVGE